MIAAPDVTEETLREAFTIIIPDTVEAFLAAVDGNAYSLVLWEERRSNWGRKKWEVCARKAMTFRTKVVPGQPAKSLPVSFEGPMNPRAWSVFKGEDNQLNFKVESVFDRLYVKPHQRITLTVTLLCPT